jgi:hypothetical protein
MKKFLKNGKVAILYSPGFGAGWYTWNEDFPELLYDPEIVKMVMENKKEKIPEYLENKYNKDGYIPYAGGSEDLEIEWLTEGTPFKISEYDGSENIVILNDLYLIA